MEQGVLRLNSGWHLTNLLQSDWTKGNLWSQNSAKRHGRSPTI